MPTQVLEKQLLEIQDAFRQIGDILIRVGSSPSQPVPAVGPVVSPPMPSDMQSLAAFLKSVNDLDSNEMKAVVDGALKMLANVYVHLPAKRSMYGIAPLQRLTLLKSRLDKKSARQFHDEMIEIFHSLRDLHTTYYLPEEYRDHVAVLPFLVEVCVDKKYIVTRWLDESEVKIPIGSAICDWNGVEIERAVELVAAREAGSNDDARHAWGLNLLTFRPMEMTAPPDEQWVTVGYILDGRRQEARFDWRVMVVTPSPSGIAGRPAARGRPNKYLASTREAN